MDVPEAAEGSELPQDADHAADGDGPVEAERRPPARGGPLRAIFQKLRQHLRVTGGGTNLTAACAPFLDDHDCLSRDALRQALSSVGIDAAPQETDALFRHIARGKGQGDPMARLTNATRIEVSELCWHYYRHDGAAGSDDEGEAQREVRHLVRPEHRCSARFAAYYRRQGVVPEGEWAAFLAALQTPLPMALRVNPGRPFHALIQSRLRALFPALQPAAWCPGAFSCPDAVFHANAEGKAWVRQQHRAGLLTFQELASMLPCTLLQPQPHHAVLDMCAAPGSKALQCLELLGSGAAPCAPPSGLVVANDVDYKKCTYILPARAKRAHSPCLVITMGNAARFPAFTAGGCQLYFDRVLCDVPCSGDGTLRKAPAGWHTWSPALGIALHHKQLQLLLQGLCRLAVGGRLVYSTCSLDPLQNEAVVAAALAKCQGSAVLCPPDAATELRLSAGLCHWVVPDLRTGGCQAFFAAWEEVPEDLRHPRGSLRRSMFPPADSGRGELLHCRRLLPHHNDTGAFFVAVFERRCRMVDTRAPGRLAEDAADAEAGASAAAAAAPSVAGSEAGGGGPAPDWRRFHRWRPLAPAGEAWAAVAAFYGLAGTGEVPGVGPRLNTDHLVARHADVSEGSAVRQVVLLSAAAAALFKATVSRPGALQYVAGGLRLFEAFNPNFLRQSACRFRPCQEGARLLAACTTRRVLRVPLDVFCRLLEVQEIPLDAVSELPDLAMFREAEDPTKLLVGGLLVVLGDGRLAAADGLCLAAMLTTSAVQALAEQSERAGMLEGLRLWRAGLDLDSGPTASAVP